MDPAKIRPMGFGFLIFCGLESMVYGTVIRLTINVGQFLLYMVPQLGISLLLLATVCLVLLSADWHIKLAFYARHHLLGMGACGKRGDDHSHLHVKQ